MLSGKTADYMKALSYIYIQNSYFDRAVTLLECLWYSLNQRDAWVGKAMGYAYIKSGRIAKACKLLDQLCDDPAASAEVSVLRHMANVRRDPAWVDSIDDADHTRMVKLLGSLG